MRMPELGEMASITRAFTDDDLREYASLAGLATPPSSVPGPLLAGMFSYLLGTELPGRGTNYLKQWLRFVRTAMTGDVLTASVEVVRLRPEKELVNLRTVCRNGAGEVVCAGEALVLVRDVM